MKLERRLIINPRRIQRILDIPRRIPLERDPPLPTRFDMVLRNHDIPQHVGRLDDRRRQPHLDVPLDMAVEQVHPGVISVEAQHGEGLREHGDGVAPRRLGVIPARGALRAGPVARAGVRAVEDLEVVAVEVEGVDAPFVVVDYDVDDVAARDDEGVHRTVDGLVGVKLADCRGRVEGGDFGLDVWAAVDAVAGFNVSLILGLPTVP